MLARSLTVACVQQPHGEGGMRQRGEVPNLRGAGKALKIVDRLSTFAAKIVPLGASEADHPIVSCTPGCFISREYRFRARDVASHQMGRGSLDQRSSIEKSRILGILLAVEFLSFGKLSQVEMDVTQRIDRIRLRGANTLVLAERFDS